LFFEPGSGQNFNFPDRYFDDICNAFNDAHFVDSGPAGHKAAMGLQTWICRPFLKGNHF
jgi:hypothetical protein